jgi:putative hydrolase of the HAD superfamily
MRPALPQAILLDLDDTILDDGSHAERIWHEVCAEAAARLRGVDAALLYDSIDLRRRWFWSDPERHRVGRLDLRLATRGFVADALAALGCSDAGVAAFIADTYRDRREAAIQPFPGAVEALACLRTRGVATAMLTNGSGPAQRAKIERFDLARHFDCILIEGEFGHGKPDPHVYAAAMDALGAGPPTTWIVGDNLEWEVAVPQRLGLRAIWIDPHRRGLPEDTDVRPHAIIHSLGELLPEG